MREPRVRNPRAEADSLLSGGHRARVLEPSPPASTDPEAGADDPTDPSMAEGRVVTPIPGEGISWDSLAEARPELEGFVAANWLGERGRLRPLPERFAATRDSLHQFAFFALAPKRFAATRRMGLRYTRGGFGTPFFGADEQVRVEGDLLVHQREESLRWQPLGSVGEACRFLDLPYRPIWYADFRDPLEPAPPAATLEVEAESVDALGEWFGFATLVLSIKYLDDGSGHIPWLMLALVYAFNTMGELCLSPIGLSMVSKLAAPKETGMAMGAWFLCSAMGNWVAGKTASIAVAANTGIGGYVETYTFIAYAGFGMGAAYLLFAPLINRLMHGVR